MKLLRELTSKTPTTMIAVAVGVTAIFLPVLWNELSWDDYPILFITHKIDLGKPPGVT